MRLVPRLLISFALCAAPMLPASPTLPPLAGDLSGVVALPQIPNAPALQWHATLTPKGAATQSTVLAEGSGTVIRLESEYTDIGREGAWKLTGATIDLAGWQRAIQPWLGGEPKDWELRGNVSLSGTGVWKAGLPSGEIVVSLRDGFLANTKAGWKLEGITLGGHFVFDARAGTLRSSAPLTFSIATITTRRFGARNLALHGTLDDPHTFALTSARIEIAGGDMVAGATRVALQPLHFMADVTINRIGLQDVAALVPTALRSGRGRVDGTVQLGWADGQIDIGRGHLVLRSDEPAEVTLHPFPGLLTSWMKPWMRSMPGWLVKWPGPGLQKAEMGETAIEAHELDVTFWPEPDAEGRTAIVHLVGVPKGSMSRTPVDIVTNVHGSLKPFIQFGVEKDLSISISK